MVLLGKKKKNTIEVSISKVLINSYIRHEIIISSVNNFLREYNEMKREIKEIKLS